ncbi:vacuolar protein sorting-associated protein 11 homolog [Drosophila biarmipes]|uniref:vacuolar protein sorting-associated protein 11 homolog n=1 Tax=Drosophila biarmipes TaxID=125945 RepID=UPI0007E6CE40|nr:vacuolar protein sorting-associated protein 11 homolog [Drosophila biarmipes]
MDKSVSEWKNVDLFDTTPLSFVKCPTTAEILCYCFYEAKSSTEEMKIRLVICDRSGNILIYLWNWECVTFKSQARPNPITLCYLTINNWLATATPIPNCGIHIDIYDLRRLTKKQGAPIIASAYFQVTSTASCINAAVVDDKILFLAIGLENGNILLHYGKITKNFSANIRQHTVSEYVINGIHFDIKKLQSDLTTQIMFVTCIQGVYCFVLKEKSGMEQIFILDDDKSNHCSTMRRTVDDSIEESMLVVGRSDAIYCYTREGRGPCFAIDGTKKCIAWVGYYLVVATRKSFLKHNISNLIVVDTENKIIVFQKQLQELFYIMSDNHFCLIINNSHVVNTCKVLLLEQLNMSKKIRLLIKQNMYDIALRMLHREGFSCSSEAAFVRFQYGNHLILKGEISRAVKEFIKTIGFIKPYSVISKLLHSRYNNYLLEYLYECQKINKTSSNHTKLIECCINRDQIKHKIEHLSDGVYPLSLTSKPEKKHLSDLSKMYFGWKIQNQSRAEEEHLLHRLLEYEPESLLACPKTYLENIKTEHLNGPDNILSFFSMLPQQNEHCAKLLSEIIEKFPNSNQKLNFYLLVLYLILWRENKVTKSFILEFIRKVRLRVDKRLIICRLYTFLNGIQEITINQQNETLYHETVNKFIQTLIENNPEVAINFNFNEITLLMMLHSFCSHDTIKAFHIKPVLRKKIVCDLVDSANEIQLIKNFNDKINRSSLMLSLYKNNPMEFRNDSCDICRETLNTQSIYFLCQHSFHKECLNYNWTKRGEELICVVCKTKSSLVNIKSLININSDPFSIIAVIAKVIAIGFKKLPNESIIQKPVKTIAKRNHQKELQDKSQSAIFNNPFE